MRLPIGGLSCEIHEVDRMTYTYIITYNITTIIIYCQFKKMEYDILVTDVLFLK